MIYRAGTWCVYGDGNDTKNTLLQFWDNKNVRMCIRIWFCWWEWDVFFFITSTRPPPLHAPLSVKYKNILVFKLCPAWHPPCTNRTNTHMHRLSTTGIRANRSLSVHLVHTKRGWRWGCWLGPFPLLTVLPHAVCYIYCWGCTGPAGVLHLESCYITFAMLL